jgi:hypothetical protein
MDPFPEHEIIMGYHDENYGDEEWERVLDCLRRNHPALKELTLTSVYGLELPWILEAFDAMATNSSLKILNIEGGVNLIEDIERVQARRAFGLNTSLEDIRINDFNWSTSLLDIVMASPNLQFLTIRYNEWGSGRPSVEDITAMMQMLCGHVNLHSLTFEGFQMDSDTAAAFATAFQGNQTIKSLIMRRDSVNATSAVSFVAALPHDHALEVLVFEEHELLDSNMAAAFATAFQGNQTIKTLMMSYPVPTATVSFVEALSHDHSLETIIFDRNCFHDDHVVSIVRTLSRKHLKTLSLLNNYTVSEGGYERIVQTLKENDHGFIRLDLFQDSEDSPWQNNIRLEIEKLTWKNRLQFEKDAWVNRFLAQDAPIKELIFRALERVKKVDNEQFSKAPNMLFYLVKESPDFIVQAIRDGL